MFILTGAVLTFLILNTNSQKIGPAVYTTKNVIWMSHDRENCPADEFAFTVATVKQQPIIYSDIRMMCHGLSNFANTTPGEACTTFALGYQAEYVVGEGVSAIHLECEHNEWITTFSHDSVCFEPVVLGKRFKCNSGWALCRIEFEKHFTTNFQFSCCGLPDEISHLTETNMEAVNGSIYEVLGLPSQPDHDLRNETWHNTFCSKDELATALVVLPTANVLFQLQCGQKETRSNSCPLGIEGLHIVKMGNVIAEIGISCLSGDHYNVYRNVSMGDFGLPRHYRCSEGYAVCGLGVRDGVAYNNENCGSGDTCVALSSRYLYPKDIKLYCCKVPDNITPCESEAFFEPPTTVGLDSVHFSSKLSSESFNHYKTNSFLLKLIESMQLAAKPHSFDFSSFNFTERPADLDQTYQLVIRCGEFKVRTDKYKKIAGSCREIKDINVSDCKCVESVGKPNCSFYYETHAVSTFENLLVKGQSYIYKIMDKHAKGKWVVGLYSKNETAVSSNSLDLSGDISEQFQGVLCSHLGNKGLAEFSLKRKEVTGTFDIVMKANTSVFHFQLTADCQDYIIKFNIYRSLPVDMYWDQTTINCRMPIDDEFSEELFRYDCGYKESHEGPFGVLADKFCLTGSGCAQG